MSASLLAGPAGALPITLEFTGTINSSTLPGISPGETFTFTLGYDDASPDLEPDPAIGTYAWTTASVDFSGGTSDVFVFGGIRLDDAASDVWSVIAQGGSTIDTLLVVLQDDGATALGSDALVVPVLASYPDAQLFDVFDVIPNPANGLVTGIAVVPEPSTGLLLALGLVALALDCKGHRPRRSRLAS